MFGGTYIYILGQDCVPKFIIHVHACLSTVLIGVLALQGIDPKLEFSSTSTIQETTVPGTFTELRSLPEPNGIQSDSEVR